MASQATSGKPSLLQIGYLFSLSPSELEEHLTSSDYDCVELDDAVKAGPYEDPTIADTFVVLNCGKIWYPKWYADCTRSRSWPDDKVEDSLARDTAVDGFFVSVCAYNKDAANNLDKVIGGGANWNVEYRLGRDQLRNNEPFSCIKVHGTDVSSSQVEATAESAEQEANRFQELTQLDPPLHHSVWHFENSEESAEDRFAAWNMGTCTVNGTECFYMLSYETESRGYEVSILSLDDMLKATGTTNVSDLIDTWVSENMHGDRVI